MQLMEALYMLTKYNKEYNNQVEKYVLPHFRRHLLFKIKNKWLKQRSATKVLCDRIMPIKSES